MSRGKRAVLALAGLLAVPAIVLFRRKWNDGLTGTYSADDDEGDALPPTDSYIDALMAQFCTLDCGCRGQWRATRCENVVGCARCIDGYELR